MSYVYVGMAASAGAYIGIGCIVYPYSAGAAGAAVSCTIRGDEARGEARGDAARARARGELARADFAAVAAVGVPE